MKKFLPVIVTISLIVLFTFSSYANGNIEFPKYNGPAVTLTFWSWSSGVTQWNINEFEKLYPKIKIHWKNVGSGHIEYPKLLTASRAGSGAPDVVQIEYQELPTFISYGGLVNLAKYGAEKYKSLFVPWTWRQVSNGNAVYAIPQDTGPIAYAYNKAIFDKYGLTVPKTWNEFAKDAEKLYKESNGKIALCNVSPTTAQWLIGLVWAAGGHWWEYKDEEWIQTINSPISRKVIDFWGGLINKGYVSTIPWFTVDWYQALSNDKIASVICPAWLPGHLMKNLGQKNFGQWRIADLPQWIETEFSSGNSGGSTDAVTIQCKHPEAAFIFALWLNASEESSRHFIGHIFPASLSALNSPLMHNTNTPTDQFFNQDINNFFIKASKNINTDFAWAPWVSYVYAKAPTYFYEAIKEKISWKQVLDKLQEDSLSYAKNEGFNVK